MWGPIFDDFVQGYADYHAQHNVQLPENGFIPIDENLGLKYCNLEHENSNPPKERSMYINEFVLRKLINTAFFPQNMGFAFSDRYFVSLQENRGAPFSQSAIPLYWLPVVMHHLASGLADLHEVGIVHGDVHPKNIVYNNAGIASLIDLGGSTIVGLPPLSSTPEYFPPELDYETLMDRTDYTLNDYAADPAQDIWALGRTRISELDTRHRQHRQHCERYQHRPKEDFCGELPQREPPKIFEVNYFLFHTLTHRSQTFGIQKTFQNFCGTSPNIYKFLWDLEIF